MSTSRLPEERIKAGILHPEEEVRLTALGYFADCDSRDESIMRLAIEATEAYGVESAFRMLRDAERLQQSPETIDWLIVQLERNRDLSSVANDNHRAAVALILCNARPDLIASRHAAIRDAPLFPGELRVWLDETVAAACWDWSHAWSQFLDCSERLSRKRKWTGGDHRRLYRLLRLLARYPEGQRQVLALHRREDHGVDEGLAEWIDVYVVELAGRMRLEAALPHVIERAHLAEDIVADQCGDALGRIGTDAVVEAIAADWDCGDFDFRHIMCSALNKIHTDRCVSACLELLDEEEDDEIQLELGDALLCHFAFAGVDPVRRLVCGDEDDLDAEQFGLRWRLVATATIMGVEFPEYEAWHADAVRTNYGWGVRVMKLWHPFSFSGLPKTCQETQIS